ncbi:unnamed protein product, partial [Oppiella nova]
ATDKKMYIFMAECQPKSVLDKFKKSETVDENEAKKPSHVIQDKESRVKVVGMNQCCFYWDPDMETVVSKKRLSKQLFDKSPHLPPEAFKAETWDPSAADVWAFGCLMCELLAKESPFKLKNKQTFDEQWKAFAESKQFSGEAKQLLDRILTEDLQNRPNIWDVLKDPYFKNIQTISSPQTYHKCHQTIHKTITQTEDSLLPRNTSSAQRLSRKQWFRCDNSR